MISRLLLAATTAALALALIPAPSSAEEEHEGRRDYLNNCAVCHGAEGIGNGPMAELFDPPPINLTLLSKNNGGSFPFQRVFDSIDGREEVKAHGTRQMPVWGEAFQVTEDDPYGPGGEYIVAGRILLLAHYLRSIQVEE